MSYLELSLEDCHRLSIPVLPLLVPTTILAIYQCYPKHLYLCYFAKLLEIFLAL
nr:MAG TPA: hypothetical protein [Caudoviricetes sp.]